VSKTLTVTKNRIHMNRQLLTLHGLTKHMTEWLKELSDIGITHKQDEYELRVAFRSWIARLEQMKDEVRGDGDVLGLKKFKKSREQDAHSNQNQNQK